MGGKTVFHINGPAPYPHAGCHVYSNEWVPILNQWYHLAVAKSGDTYTFYRDGVADGTDSATLAIPTINAPLEMGRAEGGAYFNGIMDEVRIYNYALSQFQIQEDRRKCTPSTPTATGTPTISPTARPTLTPTPAATLETPTVTPSITALYRWWNGNTHDHFYTTKPSGELAPTSGYVSEGIECYVATTQIPDTTPLYRWWHHTKTDHFYTTKPSGELAPTSGYVSEGIECYVATTQIPDTIPLYRWWNGNTHNHFYTTKPSGELAPTSGYVSEGITGYVWTTTTVTPAVTLRPTPAPTLTKFKKCEGDKPYLYVEDRVLGKGKTIEIPIMMCNAKDLANMDLDWTYDASVLKIIDVTPGSLNKKALFDWNEVCPGKLKITFASSKGVSDSGSIAVMKFEVIGNTGTTSIITGTVDTASTTDGSTVSVGVNPGEFTVGTSSIKGDCDGDGELTVKDALVALQISVERIPFDICYDYNDDGKVNSADARDVLKAIVRGGK